MDSVVGREDELSRLCAAVAGARHGAAAVVLEGEAGIGKTTLWQAGVQAAHDRSVRVLSARPAAAERDLAYAGLGDLLDGAVDEVLVVLPEPQRRALEVALLLAGPEGQAPGARAVALALLTGLRSLSADGPVLVGVDDVQWLDASTAAALEFALRRLHDQPILVLIARRRAASGPALELALPADRIERFEVAPLRLGATHRLLRQRLGRSFPRPTLLRVQELSGGNPFFALELALALERAGVAPEAGEPFPVPETLETLVADRMKTLPETARPVLLAAAASAEPTVSLLESGWPRVANALEAARRAEVVRIDGARVRFAHPLLASVLYEQADPAERRGLHGRLAGLVEDPVERARHLALAAKGPDASVAVRLDEAAGHVRARGAPIAAAELGELAILATPLETKPQFVPRLLQTARDHLAAGADDRARALGREVLRLVPQGRARAEALLLLSELEGQEGTLDREIELLRSSLHEAGDDAQLGLVIRWRLGNAVRFSEGPAAGLDHARAALELAERVDDDALTSRALATLAELMLYAGEQGAVELAGRSLGLARRSRDPEAISHALWSLGCCLTWAGRVAEARDALEEANASLAGRDDVKAKLVLWLLAVVELRAGRWTRAREYAEQRLQLSEMLAEGDPNASIPLALVLAYRGEETEARAIAERGIAQAEASGRPFFASWHRGVLGQLELWGGNPAAAVGLFGEAMRVRSSVGFREPASPLYRVDYVEALLEVGGIDEALGVLRPWESEAQRLQRDWALAETTRSYGLVAAARGRVEEAGTLLERAFRKHEDVGDPFGRARALLALGIVQRRARRKRAAREAIEQALQAFETLGAARWVDKARGELGRIGGRRREEGLTAAERRVAALAAQGQTNREVAAALFLSERTVESHLSRVYAKLGVRSRTELARTLQ